MNITEFIIEFEGISNTIKAYTNDHFIIGYLNNLEKALKSNDDTITLLTLTRINNWYDKVIDEIQESNFVYNKNQHLYAQKVIKDFYSVLKTKQQ
jgi:hypothetical protein